jgi:hypothetical protein
MIERLSDVTIDAKGTEVKAGSISRSRLYEGGFSGASLGPGNTTGSHAVRVPLRVPSSLL